MHRDARGKCLWAGGVPHQVMHLQLAWLQSVYACLTQHPAHRLASPALAPPILVLPPTPTTTHALPAADQDLRD
jgi:hypothetical protein